MAMAAPAPPTGRQPQNLKRKANSDIVYSQISYQKPDIKTQTFKAQRSRSEIQRQKKKKYVPAASNLSRT
jgi:hypothetical protein